MKRKKQVKHMALETRLSELQMKMLVETRLIEKAFVGGAYVFNVLSDIWVEKEGVHKIFSQIKSKHANSVIPKGGVYMSMVAPKDWYGLINSDNLENKYPL
jgi:hypothetical protein